MAKHETPKTFIAVLTMVGLVAAREIVAAWLEPYIQAQPGWIVFIVILFGLISIAWIQRNRLQAWIRGTKPGDLIQDWKDLHILKKTGSDILQENQFADLVAHYLRNLEGNGIVTFYNIPLATLRKPELRHILWEEGVIKNSNVKELRLVLAQRYARDFVKYIGKITDRHAVADYEEKTSVAFLDFPEREVLNFACVVEDANRLDPYFASATIQAPPFWRNESEDFSHFFAFNTRLDHTRRICLAIKNHINDTWNKICEGAPGTAIPLHGSLAHGTLIRFFEKGQISNLQESLDEIQPET